MLVFLRKKFVFCYIARFFLLVKYVVKSEHHLCIKSVFLLYAKCVLQNYFTQNLEGKNQDPYILTILCLCLLCISP